MTVHRNVDLFQCDAPSCSEQKTHPGYSSLHNPTATEVPPTWIMVLGAEPHPWVFCSLPCLGEWVAS